jgi:hypothetical protein
MQQDIGTQQALLREQAVTLDRMKADVAGIKTQLESSRAALEKALANTNNLVEQFNAIDVFVRRIIEAESRLEELQK